MQGGLNVFFRFPGEDPISVRARVHSGYRLAAELTRDYLLDPPSCCTQRFGASCCDPTVVVSLYCAAARSPHLSRPNRIAARGPMSKMTRSRDRLLPNL